MVNVIRLTMKDIVAARELILGAIERSLPPTFAGDGDESEGRFYQALISGLMQAWVVKNGDTMKCICVTMVSGDQFSMEKDLLIYALYGIGEMDQETIATGMDVLARYAKALGCQRLTLYTEHDNMVDAISHVTGVDPLVQQYVSFDVEEMASPQQVVNVEPIGA